MGGLSFTLPRFTSLSTIPLTTMPLNRKQNRLFVLAFLVLAFAMALFATVSIYQGWNDEEFQRHVQEAEKTNEPPKMF